MKYDIRNRYILLDSCIIQYLASEKKELAGKINDLLVSLKTQGNFLCISDFSYFEILRGLSEEKKDDVLKFLNGFVVVKTNLERLKRAGNLYSKYRKNPYINKIISNISDGDLIIGSLIFTKDQPLLLTADYLGFPRPFFVESEVERIEYKNGPRFQSLYLYNLKPNLEAFLQVED